MRNLSSAGGPIQGRDVWASRDAKIRARRPQNVQLQGNTIGQPILDVIDNTTLFSGQRARPNRRCASQQSPRNFEVAAPLATNLRAPSGIWHATGIALPFRASPVEMTGIFFSIVFAFLIIPHPLISTACSIPLGSARLAAAPSARNPSIPCHAPQSRNRATCNRG